MTAQMSTMGEAGAPPVVSKPRLFYMDNLRILLTALVVIHHAAITYGNIPIWYYAERAQDASGIALDVLSIVNQIFFMGFFFMIAGFFVPGAVDRHGPKKFMKGRLLRLGVPLLLFLMLVRPFLTFSSYLKDYRDQVPYWLYYVVSWDPGPLWFVEVLLLFSAGYVLLRRRTPRQAASPAVPVPAAFPGPLAVFGFGAALSLVTFLWRFLVPTGAYWPVVGLPTPAFLPQYLGLFVVGVYAYRKGWFAEIPRAVTGWSALGCVIFVIGNLATFDSLESGGPVWIRLLGDVSECGLAISLILLLLSLFHRRFNQQGAFGKVLSDNAFAVYFLHPAILVAGATALSGWHAPAVAKFAVLAALALPTTWAVAILMRKIPLARKVF